MKTFTKLTVVTAIFALIFSCSTPEEDITPIETADVTYTKEKESDLVEQTLSYFKAIDEIVLNEKDPKLANNLTEELLTEYSKVLEEKGGIKEVQNVLRILQDSYKTANQSKQEDPCQVGFRKCAISALVDLVEHVVGGGDTSTGILAAYTSILGCVGGYVDCVFN